MIDLSTPNEWQHVDPASGLLFPWYTKSFLDELVTWDLKDKVAFEYGCGASTLWWAAKCKKVYSAESNIEYFHAVVSNYATAPELIDKTCIYLLHGKRHYIDFIKVWGIYDIIIIDGLYRDECVPIALEHLRPGGKLIFDNWMQPSVEVQTEETQ